MSRATKEAPLFITTAAVRNAKPSILNYMNRMNKYSRTITEDESQPSSQSMPHGIGLSESDLNIAQVGITSSGYEGNPCNVHLNDLAKLVKKGLTDQGLIGLIFHTIGVSDAL